MKILNGSELAGFIKERQAKQVRALRQAHGIAPKLAIVTDVDNPVIEIYMRLKKQYGADILIDVEVFRVPSESIIEEIEKLNGDHGIHGIIVQLPIKDMAKVEQVLASVAPDKDVDGLNPHTEFDPATPTAINWLLAGYSIELKDKKIAILGAGRLVGSPLERMWRNSGLDVTAFSRGDDLSVVKGFDVIVTATGSPSTITNAMIKPRATLIDAGTAVEDGRVCGDVADEVRQRNDINITPIKGGVGPLTVVALFDNVIKACLKIANSKN